MADKMYVIITARKEVPDISTARELFDLVKQKLEDYPTIEINGQTSNHFDLDAS